MADLLDRLTTALADRYAIERELGAGGMATVHLAQDFKHERQVAVKVLRPELAAALGSERFLREIKVTANLQHPNILPLFDSGEASGFLYYVMPYVRGETLREKLNREKQLALDEAVAITREVALALDYAHRERIIHRDIKPENVLLQEGRALVADFGIALAVAQAGEGRLTETGLSLGTPSYMSPEQAMGDRQLDARSDVYSLACVLYEMLAGDPPHTGTNPQAVIAKVLTDEPTRISAIRKTVPPHVEAALDRALAKAPADRWPTAAAFAEALTKEGGVSAPTGRGRARSRIRVGVAIAVTVLVAAVALLSPFGPQAGEPVPTMLSEQLTSFLGREYQPSWNPDGSMITFGHTLEGHMDIFVMSVPEGDPVRLTDHPADDTGPRWSPTGERIAFLSDRGAGLDVMVIAPTGGRERKVASTHMPFLENARAWFRGLGADAWSPDGQQLLFSRRDSTGAVGVWKVNVATGEQTQLTAPPLGVMDFGGSWSPDGSQIVFDRGQYGRSSLWIMSADGGEPRILLDELEWAFQAAWMPSGKRLVFLGDWNIWTLAVASGERRQLTTGRNFILGVDVGPREEIAYSVSGHLTNLYWGDRNAPPDRHENLTRHTLDDYGARVSHDGRRIVYNSDRNGTMDVWMYDRETGQRLPLTRGPATDIMPDWMPNGGVVFVSDRGGELGNRLWTIAREGAEPTPFAHGIPPINCLVPYCRKGPNVSPDGRLVGFIAASDVGETLWIAGIDGSNPRPTRLRGARSFDWYLDSRRVVYTATVADGSGRVELRAADLESGEEVLLFAGSVAEPAVTSDGRVVSFVHAASHYNMNTFLLQLEPRAAPDGLPRPVGAPRALIDGQGVWHVHNFAWTPDGRSFVYTRDEDDGDIFVLREDVASQR